MTTDDLLSHLRELFEEQASIPPDMVQLETTFDELGLDSLDTIELIIDLEDELEIEMDDGTTEACKTVQDLITYLLTLNPTQPR